MNIEIIICTERGPLEGMSKLLVWSLRNNGGSFSNIPIYTYMPRNYNQKLSNETLSFFEQNEVVIIDEILNKKYTSYPLANKPLSCAHRESNTKADYLIFLDSDSLFLSEPYLFSNLVVSDFFVNPVDFNTIGTNSTFSRGEYQYWSSLYKMLNVKRRRSVKTTVDKERILEYYNSGFIISKTSRGIFNHWLENFERVMASSLRPDRGVFFVEQSVLSATISQLEIEVTPLGKYYNFPVDSYNKRWSGFYPYSLSSAIHVHYHKTLFNRLHRIRFLKKLRQLQNGDDFIKVLENYIT